MSGFFGIVSKRPCITDLFYGIDYHSHLGTTAGGICTFDGETFHRDIHSLKGSYFRTKFEDDLPKFTGNSGIGIISDTDAQPIVVNSHLGKFAIVTVGKITNIKALEQECLDKMQHFAELSHGDTNPTELVALLITQGKDFVDGIQNVYNKVKGSVSMLILTTDGSIIAARDLYGRTPIVIGKDDEGYVAAFESHSYINLDYTTERFIGPGEIVRITTDGLTQLKAPNDKMQICSFLWIYYGFPASDYENINVEEMRYRGGYAMGMMDDVEVDYAAPIPDSGIGMAIGYSNAKQIPYVRSVVKYTPTWSRSFMPINQSQREHVAKMKLIPNRAMLKGKRVVFCDDSIVRGTQLRDNVKMLYDFGAKEVHIRLSCPPLNYGCQFLNFSASKNELELITRRCIAELEGGDSTKNLALYSDSTTKQYANLVEMLRKHVGVDSLKFNTLDNICKAIGLPKCQVCTHCFDGSSYGDK
ncbi:MAG: amidophosphoribosyltransferase [Bacteroidales bacterium]|nr:amidophosphoribosyltransferase [Bacteroidales bacterium]